MKKARRPSASALLRQQNPQRIAGPQCKIAGMKFDVFRGLHAMEQTLAALILVSIALAATNAWTQSKSTGLDPRVEQLYTEAKDAEDRGDVDTAIAKYESILQIAPSLAAAYNNLGALYLRQHEYAKAVDTLEKGLKIDLKLPSASALLGISLYETGDYARARPRLEAALRANPKDSNIELTLANDLVKLDEPEAAVTHLQQIARREPKNQQVWYQLGKLYMQLSQDALTRLREVDPDSYLVHEVSGEIMESMNNFDGAIIEYKKAVEMAPQEPGTHFKLGRAYWAILAWDAATQQFQAELANDPRNCPAQWKLGNIILQQHGDPQAALDDVNKALAMCPNLTGARLDRAKALLRMERAQEAIPDLEAAERESPDEPDIHYLLAQAYRSTGRAQQAQSEMQLFRKLEESARAAKAARTQELLKDKQQNAPQ
jgi:tetratricopeptide (TPR) repeat protein